MLLFIILLRIMNMTWCTRMTCTWVKQLPKQLEASNLKFGKQLEASTQNWQNLELLIKKKRVFRPPDYSGPKSNYSSLEINKNLHLLHHAFFSWWRNQILWNLQSGKKCFTEPVYSDLLTLQLQRGGGRQYICPLQKN